MKNASYNLGAVFCLIIGLYAVSFFLPVIASGRGGYPGFSAFMIGGRSLMEGSLGSVQDLLLPIGWLANPVFWCGLILLAKRRWLGALSVGTVAFLMALSVTLWKDLGLAYWVWLASMFLLSGAGLIGLLGWYSNE